MRNLKIALTAGGFEVVPAQLFTMHIPSHSGASPVAWQFFYAIEPDGLGVVYEKVSGKRFNVFFPTNPLSKTRTIKEARAAVGRRLAEYGREQVTKILKGAQNAPLNGE